MAARALFVDSNLGRARSLSGRALQRDPRDAEALFVQMEVATMQADDMAALNSAVRLCELGRRPDDPRVGLAAVRVRELAANTPQVRNVIPRVWSLVTSSPHGWPALNSALLSAAMDGMPGLDPYALSRASGILTNWRVVSLGRHSLLDFGQSPISMAADLSRASYQNHLVESFQFPDGRMALPNYLQRREMFYAASQFASIAPSNWTVSIEDADAAEIFIDGDSVLRVPASQGKKHNHNSARFEVTAGPHRVLVKFAGAAQPWRISILPSESPVRTPARSNVSLQESTYELAAEDYAAGDFGAAIQQIDSVQSASDSAALQFLLAQSWTQLSPLNPGGATAWSAVRSLAPLALAADVALGKRALRNQEFAEASSLASHVLMGQPLNVAALEILAPAQARDERSGLAAKGDVWPRLLSVHPSCKALHGAIQVYRSQGRSQEANVAQQQLEGCAPESTDYARLLSEGGEHAKSAQALQRLLAVAPLNREARLMLVSELQMAGNDTSAQRAASEWLRIAPNAGSYHRLAGNDEAPTSGGSVREGLPPAVDFYLPYRRDAIQAARQASFGQFAGEAVVLLDDHVAIARPDGSVSLYVHTVTRLRNLQGLDQLAETVPRDAQVLELRLIHGDGSVDPIGVKASGAALSSVTFSAGDVLDKEYVMHYAGDGGIPEHSEVFQFVFGNFNRRVLSTRFVALTPAEHADRGVVIATGNVPRMTARIHDSMLARVWQEDAAAHDGGTHATANKTMAIVRVVEQDNGWTVPSNAEHRRRIETIHPGPRLEDSSLPMPRRDSSSHNSHDPAIGIG